MFDTQIIMTFLNEFFESNNFEEKNSRRNFFVKNYPACKELRELTVDSHLDIWNYFMA